MHSGPCAKQLVGEGECAESTLRDPHLVRVDKTLQRLNVVMSQEEYRVSATEVQGWRNLTLLGTQGQHCQEAGLHQSLGG